MKVITKKEAKEKGLKRYFTGKPCKHGHVAERHVGTGGCIPCRLAFEKTSQSRHKYTTSDKGQESRNKSQEKYNLTDKARARGQRWRSKNPEKLKENYLKLKRENPERLILATVKSRAKDRNLEFNLDIGDIIIPDFCPILKIPLFVGDTKHCDNSPSLDRSDSSKGYIKGNVEIISYRANMLKNNGSLEEFEMLVSYLKSKKLGG